MAASTVRLTMAQAIVRYLINQYTTIDGEKVPLFAGVFGIFGHGNVTCLSEALEQVQDRLPTWRGQNEQSMALAAIAYSKAKLRRQIMVATTSVGPGATNMVPTVCRCCCCRATLTSTAFPTPCCNRSNTSAILRSP